jgi:hypothetical protein
MADVLSCEISLSEGCEKLLGVWRFCPIHVLHHDIDNYMMNFIRKSSPLYFRWDTVLHAENKQAKFMAAANNMRVKALRRKMEELQKRRTIMFGKPLNSARELEADYNNNSRKKKFMLDMGSRSKEEKNAEVLFFNLNLPRFFFETKLFIFQPYHDDNNFVVLRPR